jgi:hypothetical protein
LAKIDNFFSVKNLIELEQNNLKRHALIKIRFLLFYFIFWCAPFIYLYFLYFQSFKKLGGGIDLGMALTPFSSSLDEI